MRAAAACDQIWRVTASGRPISMTAQQPLTQLTRSHWRPTTAEPPLRLTIAGLLSAAVARRPDHIALVDGVADPDARRRWTYRELEGTVRKVAIALRRRFEVGDHVALWSPNSADWVLFQIGAGLAGVVLVTVNPAYRDAELAYVLRGSHAHGVFFADEYRGRDLGEIARATVTTIPSVQVIGSLGDLLAEAAAIEPSTTELPHLAAGAIAQVQYTSGTTGFPKGAMLTHGGITTACEQVARRALPEGGPLTYLNPMPLFHIGGSGVATVGTLTKAGTHVVMPRFDVDLWLSLVESERATITMAVPTMLIAILEHPRLADHDLESLQTILTGGAHVPTELVHRAAQLGANVMITFGQTESHGTMCTTRRHDSADDISTTVGLPVDHVEVAIADPVSGEIVEVGVPGEILVRGDQVMAGYYNSAQETDAAIDEAGWLHFGDLGTMDERGYLRVIGRLKDMVIRGGENIYPREIEDVLLRHPSVAEVAVVGVPDATWGEEVAAVIRLQPGTGDRPEPAALLDYCRERLAHYKCPRLWFYVPAFPLTASGKIQKHRIVASIVGREIASVGSFVRKVGAPSARHAPKTSP